MTTPAIQLNPTGIADELYSLTVDMVGHCDDPDFLIAGIEKRQALMDDYDKLGSGTEVIPEHEKKYIREKVNEILVMDKKISNALNIHRSKAKTDLRSSNSQQKLLGYTNNAISSSGSYMDFKK